MPGSIQKRGDKYLLTISEGRGPGGKRQRFTKTVTAKDEKEAEKQLALFYSEVVQNSFTKASTIFFGDFIKKWLKDYAENKLEPKTFDSYKRELNSRIIPALGHIKLDKVTPLTLLNFYNSLRKDGVRMDKKSGGLSEKSIRYYHNIISSIMQSAIKWELLQRNPTRNIDRPKAKSKETAFYDEEQSKILLDLLSKAPIKYMTAIILDLFTALRRSELLAIDWKDINFEESYVDITKASQYISGKGIITKGTKNESSKRIIKLPPVVIQLLQEYKKYIFAEMENLGVTYTESSRLFAKAD